MLYQINHDYKATLWCGIAALATLTGRATSECRDVIAAYRRARGNARPKITGVFNSEMEHALQQFGFRPRMVARFRGPAKTRPTFAKWLRTREGALKTGALLVLIRRHYVVVEGKRFVDNRHTDPLWIKDASGRRKRVWRVYLVERAA